MVQSTLGSMTAELAHFNILLITTMFTNTVPLHTSINQHNKCLNLNVEDTEWCNYLKYIHLVRMNPKIHTNASTTVHATP